MSSDKITIVIVEDHQLSSVGLKLLLQQTADFEVVGEAATGRNAVELLAQLRPDIALMDIGLPDFDGIEATLRCKTVSPETRVIMLTSHQSEDDIVTSIGAGAYGYCYKDVSLEELQHAIREVHQGHRWLDKARIILEQAQNSVSDSDLDELGYADMLDLLCYVEQGLSNVEIAAELNVSVNLVKENLRKTVEKLFLANNNDNSADNQLKQSRKQLAARAGDFAIDSDASCSNLLVGNVFAGKYLIDSLVGRGGMGRVYKAAHMLTGRPVALKVLLPQFAADRRLIRFFQDEAKAASTLLHPNIVRVHDFGVTTEGQAFIVMDFVDGVDLDTMFRSNALINHVLFFSIFNQICSGLASAHNRSIVHCDLKPSNILLVRQNSEAFQDSEAFSVRLIDFGLAKIIPPAKTDIQLQITDSFEVAGSPAYMSPEQCRGNRLDARTDLYSLGCVMYEALTGKRAYEGRTPMEFISKHLEETPKSFQEVCPHLYIPAELEDLTFKLLEKCPDSRCQSAEAVKEVLKSLHWKYCKSA